MAKGKEVKNWITINGAHVPVYADGSMGGIGAKLQGKKSDAKTISEEEDQKQLDDIEAKRNKMYSIIKKVQKEYGDDDDGFAEDIMSDIIEDNGHDLSDDEIRKLASQYYDEEDDEWEGYDEQDKLEAIAERYGGSKPVSGSWDTEVEHEQNAIAEAFHISKEEAKQKMIDELGFEEDQFKSNTAMKYDSTTMDNLNGEAYNEARKALSKEYGTDDVVEIEKRAVKEGREFDEHGKEVDKKEDFPFQSKEPSREEKAEDWAKETQKDIAAKKANIKEMGYAEAGQFISDHKEEFGLSDDDDAYQIAAQIKNGDIKLDKDGKVSKADRDKVSEDLKAMDKAAKERGDYIEDEPAKGKKLEDHSDIQKIADEHVEKIWNNPEGATNQELYDAADKWAEEHNFDKTKARDAAFAAMNKKQMAEIKKREAAKSNDIDLSEYEYVANRNGYQTYRKIENGKGVWVAQDQDGKNPPFSISYDQALGHEPIITTNAEALSHEVGQKLFGKGSKKGSTGSQKKVKVGGREVSVSKEAPAELKSIKGGKMGKEEAMMNYKAIRISKYMPKEKQEELRKLKAQYYKIWKG